MQEESFVWKKNIPALHPLAHMHISSRRSP
jgi:hypothetical protein